MRALAALVWAIALAGAVSAESTDIDISLSANDLVTESFNILLSANQSYDSFDFLCGSEPSAVIFDGSYVISQLDGQYTISFQKQILPGENTLDFTLVYDNLIENTKTGKVFRAHFTTPGQTQIRLSLPTLHILSKEPAVTPAPHQLATDGHRISLTWDFSTGDNSIIVFYEGQGNGLPYIALLVAIGILVLAGVLLTLYFKHKSARTIESTLSQDEQSIVKEMKSGMDRQDKIAQKLQFSKSKMSKVLRKLEEKGLVEKEPHFKTNKMKLKGL